MTIKEAIIQAQEDICVTNTLTSALRGQETLDVVVSMIKYGFALDTEMSCENIAKAKKGN